MKVILSEDVRSLGKKHDVKDVSDGYARNFLFPNKLAEPATLGALKKLEVTKATMDKNEEELKKRLEEIVRKISETALEFTLKTGADGAVFGSVTKEQILKAMRDARFITKERISIELARPIKELGEHKVAVDLKNGIKTELKILVRPEV